MMLLASRILDAFTEIIFVAGPYYPLRMIQSKADALNQRIEQAKESAQTLENNGVT